MIENKRFVVCKVQMYYPIGGIEDVIAVTDEKSTAFNYAAKVYLESLLSRLEREHYNDESYENGVSFMEFMGKCNIDEKKVYWGLVVYDVIPMKKYVLSDDRGSLAVQILMEQDMEINHSSIENTVRLIEEESFKLEVENLDVK